MSTIFIRQDSKRFEEYKISSKRISSFNYQNYDDEVLLDFGNRLEAIPKCDNKLDFGNGLETFKPYNLDITLSEYKKKCEQVLDFSDDYIDFDKVKVIVDFDDEIDCPEWDDEDEEIEKEVTDKTEIETIEESPLEQEEIFDNDEIDLFSFDDDFKIINPFENNIDTNTLSFFANTYFLANNAIFTMPENGVLNKGLTGCGGTTTALEDDKNYFISMPYTKLVLAKYEQYKDDSFALFEKSQKGRGSETIDDYIKRRDREQKPYKIIGTYNSIRNIVNLGDKLKEMNLLIDEYQILLDDYSFRSDVINDILKYYKLFKSFTFMSATPILERYLFPELNNIPVTNVEWIDAPKPKVKIVDYTIERRTLEAVSAFIRRKVDEGLHIYCYINAVESIQKIIGANEWMTIENTKVIYSQYSKAEITDSQGNVFSKRENVNSENKDVTFITSTGFVGLDIKDELGVSIVVSMKAKREYTYHNPSTIIRQIMGRNRLKKDDTIYHFVDLVVSELQTSQERDEFTFSEIERLDMIVNNINSLQSIGEREFKINETITLNNDNIVFDTNLYFCHFKNRNKMIYDAYQYYIQSLYWSIESLKNAYLESGFEVEQLNTEELEMFARPVRRRRPNRLTEMMELYTEHGDNYECEEWQIWFSGNEGNEIYKDLIIRGLRSPEQLFNNRHSLKYWKQYLSDFRNASNFPVKVMNRIKKIGYLKPGNEFSFTGLNLACHKVEQEVLKMENNTETPELSNIATKEVYDENKKIKSGIYKKYFVTKEVKIKAKDSDERYTGLKIVGYKTIQDFKEVMKKPEKVKKTKN
jgi:hypothetical protein